MARIAGHLETRWRASWPALLTSFFARLRYNGAGSRDPRLDMMRGAFIVAILVNHLGGASWFHTVTGANRFFVSAAEGFVLLSGLVMGLVYARLITRDGLATAIPRVLRRAATLYLLALGLNVGFRILSTAAGASWAEHSDTLLAFAWDVARFQQVYYLSDVLMLYAVLVLLATGALALLARGQAGLVLLASVGVWALHQVGLTGPVDRALAGLAYFPPMAWQMIFMIGLVCGYHWNALKRRLSVVPLGLAGAALALAAAGLIILSIAAPESVLAESVVAFFGKDGLQPGRVLAAAVFFPLLYVLITLFWRPLSAALGWLLLPLGERALLGYSLHLVVCLWGNITFIHVPGWSLDDPVSNTLAHVGAVLLTWAGVMALPRRLALAWPSSAGLPRPSLASWGRLRALPVAALVVALLLVGTTFTDAGRAVVVRGATSVLVLLEQEEIARNRQAAPATAGDAEEPLALPRRAPAAGTPVARDVTVPASPLKEPAMAARPVTWEEPALMYPGWVEGGVTVDDGIVIYTAFHSQALGRFMGYRVYLPPGYAAGAARYPALYMLHGVGGDSSEWVTYGLLDTATSLISSGRIEPLIIVLPEGDQSYWINHVGGPAWGDYLTRDLVQHIDETYRTLPEARSRAIGGLSMGAYAALLKAFTEPDVFGVAGAHSPSLRTEADAPPFFGRGDDFQARDPFTLVQTGQAAGRPHLWIDIGVEDWYLEPARAMHAMLEARGLPHEWRVLDGTHDGSYWGQHAATYLDFYSRALSGSSQMASLTDEPERGP